MKDKKHITVNIQEIVNQAIGFLSSTPCSICCCESFCDIRYKGTCKIAREIRLRLKLYNVPLQVNDTETQKIPNKFTKGVEK